MGAFSQVSAEDRGEQKLMEEGSLEEGSLGEGHRTMLLPTV